MQFVTVNIRQITATRYFISEIEKLKKIDKGTDAMLIVERVSCLS